MPTVEWGIPYEVRSPTMGTLTLNGAATGRRYVLNQKRCVARRTIRTVTTPVPQGDGEIFHKRWANGIEIQFAVQLWDGQEIACDLALCEMRDELYGIVWSLLRPAGPVFTQSGGRVVWTPSCPGNRMLDAVHLRSIEDPDEDAETGATEITFVLDSPFPYAVSETQTVANLNGLGGSITNNGNVEYWPVLKIYSDGIDITNNTTGKQISFDSGCLGGGSYIEVETFRMTAYVDGDQANAKPCVNLESTEFFALAPGANQIDTTGSVDFLVNDAYA